MGNYHPFEIVSDDQIHYVKLPCCVIAALLGDDGTNCSELMAVAGCMVLPSVVSAMVWPVGERRADGWKGEMRAAPSRGGVCGGVGRSCLKICSWTTSSRSSQVKSCGWHFRSSSEVISCDWQVRSSPEVISCGRQVRSSPEVISRLSTELSYCGIVRSGNVNSDTSPICMPNSPRPSIRGCDWRDSVECPESIDVSEHCDDGDIGSCLTEKPTTTEITLNK